VWGKSVGQKLIVVADDDPACRGLMAEILTDAGYACVEAECGRSALALIDLRPDLLLTDLFMPDLDGIEIILKAKQTWPGVRIAAISGGIGAFDPMVLLRMAAILGADVALPKPFSVDQLLTCVAQALAAERPSADPGAQDVR
jgi:two-component system chemotaxis response regulator CheY